LARTVVKAQKSNDDWTSWPDRSDYKYKVVKIVFDKKDFVCVGRQRFVDQRNWNLPLKENDSICIKRFKFMEK